jgi:two-component system catabolic regulation response regulator CreB
VSSPRLLLVEDESAIAEPLLYALRAEGFQAEHCWQGGQALQWLRDGGYDLVLLDVGLPDIDGFEVCRRLRGFSPVPVIFLTARGGEIDRVVGLEIGADDYVVKPFSLRELIARIRARLRERSVAQAMPRRSGDFEHDVAARRVSYRGQALDLTRYEYGLLAELLRRPGAILARDQLLDRVWTDAQDSGDRTVDTHVKTLRAKLRAIAPERDPIRTHRGLGYSIEPGS